MSRSLPPEVYRRRRIVVLAGVLGIALIVWLLVRTLLGGDGPADKPSATPTPMPTETSAAEAPEGTVPASLATGDGACEPSSVRITPSVPADQKAGGPVQIALTVSTSAAKPCVLEASASQLVVVIDDGDDPVYDSTSCNTSILSNAVRLSPQWATVTTVSWNGRVSGGSCSDAEALVGAGSYTLKLGTLGGEPGEATFTLGEAPPPPAPEPDPAAPDPAAPDPAAPDPEAAPVG